MYELEYLSQSTFATMCDEWQNLLCRSNVDPLFMSWHWQYSWWEQWGESIEAELRLIAVRLNGHLVALLPLYRCRAKLKPFDIYRLQFIGNNWGQKNTVRSEYLQAIVDSDHVSAVQPLLVSELLSKMDWHDLVLCDYPENEGGAGVFLQQLKIHGVKPVRQYREHGYSIDVNKKYSDYISGLGKNTRLKLHNRRGLIKSITPDFSYAYNVKADGESFFSAKFFEFLNDFHYSRWGKPAFDSEALSFHLSLIQRLDKEQNYSAKLSMLSDQGEVKSVLYNILVNETCYNIQSGYEENWHKKVALGTLHLGYFIESLCSRRVQAFDLLLGRGKSSDYKSLLGGEVIHANTWVFSRRPEVHLIYKLKNIVKNFLSFLKC